MLSLLAGIIGALGSKSIRRYQLPADRLADMFASADADLGSPELRRLQIGAIAGGDGDILTAEGGK